MIRRTADVLMRRLPSQAHASTAVSLSGGDVVPYPTIVVRAPSDLSSVPAAASMAGRMLAGARSRNTSPTSAMPGSRGATRMSSVGSHLGGGGQCGIDGCVAVAVTGIHVPRALASAPLKLAKMRIVEGIPPSALTGAVK